MNAYYEAELAAGRTLPAMWRRTEPVLSGANIVAFLIPCLSFVQWRVVGTFFLPEPIMLAGTALLFLDHRLRISRAARIVLGLGTLWLMSQVATDLIMETPFADYARGWANIIVTLLAFCFLHSFLRDRPARLWAFACGTAVGGVLSFLISPSISARTGGTDGWWKFGLAQPVTQFVCCLLCLPLLRRRFILGSSSLLALGGLHFMLGHRSAAGVTLAAGLFLLLEGIFRRNQQRGRGQISPLLITVVIVPGVLLAYELYDYAKHHAWTEYSLEDKIRAQQGAFGSLVGGRQGLYGTLTAIGDSPLIGHGSWGKNPKYRLSQIDLEKYGYQVDLEDELDPRLIPAHSYLLGAWVESGVLGAVFWTWCLILAARGLKRLHRLDHPLAPILYVSLVWFAWNIVFSPLKGGERVSAAFNLTLAVAALEARPHWALLNRRAGSFAA
jgi:hypothetical protein